MYSLPKDIEVIFSPLDGDISLQTPLSDKSGLISPRESPAYLYMQNETEYMSPVRPRAMSIPRKALPNYERLNGPVHTQSFDTFKTTSSYTTLLAEKAEERDVVTKRGWRFYGTFGSLALLNFICAIDATILSVALPVRIS